MNHGIPPMLKSGGYNAKPKRENGTSSYTQSSAPSYGATIIDTSCRAEQESTGLKNNIQTLERQPILNSHQAASMNELTKLSARNSVDDACKDRRHTREEHIESYTTIIWVAFALHAAVNFRQCPYAVYMPNRPPQSRRLLPEQGTTDSDELETNPVNAF
nr:probable linoleate 9S-lipoxygenase 5 [Tanacetum cinerariifolium]